jgi:hypothetical protein
MNDTNVSLKQTCPIDRLARASEAILGALQSDQHGPIVAARLPETFQTDFASAVTALVKAAEKQTGAKGSVHTLTKEQNDGLADCQRYTGKLREIARKTFTGQNALLHDAFTVGEHTPRGLASILARAVKLQASAVKHAEVLATHGWPTADTAKLAELIATLKTANDDRLGAGAAQHGATVDQINLANAVYAQCRLVQIAADMAYPAKDADSDSAIAEARSKYLLGAFPPRRSATPPADGPTPILPPSGSGSTTGAPAPTAPASGS